jgi:hypothetical protein
LSEPIQRPVTRTVAGFEEYWAGLTQDPEVFYRQYRAVHGGGETKSTTRTRRLVEELEPLNALVTNAYSYPAEEEKLIPDKPRQRIIGLEIVSRLAEFPQVRAAIFHGSAALSVATSLAGGSLDPYKPLLEQDARLRGPNAARVYVYPHLSGRGVQKGFPVGQMDTELGRLARWLKSETGPFASTSS